MIKKGTIQFIYHHEGYTNNYEYVIPLNLNILEYLIIEIVNIYPDNGYFNLVFKNEKLEKGTTITLTTNALNDMDYISISKSLRHMYLEAVGEELC